MGGGGEGEGKEGETGQNVVYERRKKSQQKNIFSYLSSRRSGQDRICNYQ